MINKQKAIDDIVDNFDWEKVHKTMVALDWKWAMEEGDTEIPSVGQLFRCAVGLLHDAYDGAEKNQINYSVRTGGFHARALVDEKEIYELKLIFEVCSWEYDELD
jgi:hypothetical protein